MPLRLSRIGPLREDANVVLGLTLRKCSFGDSNPTCSSTITLDSYTGKRRCRPIRQSIIRVSSFSRPGVG